MSGKISSVIDMMIQTSMKGTTSVLTGLKSIDTAIQSTGSSSVNAANANIKASNRMTHNTGKNFASMSANISPLIAKFAEMAAAIYVVGFAYDKINLVAKFTQTKQAFNILASTFSFNAGSMVADLKDISKGTITVSEAMSSVSIASASGLSTDQIKELAVVAKNASRAMGIDMSDAYTRIIRGVTKLEPELLDELGLITRLQGELQKYARQMGVSAESIDSLTKLQIFQAAVVKEGTAKFASLGEMEKSAAEELEGMKSSLIDSALLFGEKLIPVVLAAANAISTFGSTLVILGAYYAAHRIQIGLAAAAQTHAEVQDIKAAAAIKAKQAALDIHTASLAKNTTSLILNSKGQTFTNTAALIPKVDSKQAVAHVQLLTVAANKAKFALGAMASAGARAFAVITGPIGIFVGLVTLAADATGMLDGMWESLSGRATDLASQLEKLNTSQRIAYDVLTTGGIESWRALNLANGAYSAFIGKETDGIIVMTKKAALMDVGHNQMRVFIQDVIKGGNGTEYFIRQTKAYADISSSTLVTIRKQSDAVKDLTESLNDQDPGTQKYKKYKIQLDAALRTQRAFSEEIAKKYGDSTGVAPLLDDIKAYDKASAQLADTAQYTTKQLDKMGKTPLDRLNEQFSNVDETITAVNAKIIEATNLSQSLTDVGTGGKNEKQYKNLLKEVKDLTDVLTSAEEAKIRLDKRLSVRLVTQQAKEKTATADFELSKQKPATESFLKDRYTKDLAVEKAFTIASIAEFDKRLTAEEIGEHQHSIAIGIIQSKARVKEMSLEQKLTKDLESELNNRLSTRKTAASKALALATTSTNLTFDMKGDNIDVASIAAKYNDLIDAQNTYAKESLDIEITRLEGMGASQETIDAAKNASAKLNSAALLDLSKQGNAGVIAQHEKTVKANGSMWQNMQLDAKAYFSSIGGSGQTLSSTLGGVFQTLSSTMINELGKAFGFIEDKAKTSFNNALIAAQASYAGMVKAANDAFGLAQRDQGVSNSRALQDIETGRVRDIADLTANRNSGSVDQAQFDQGITDINTGVRRAQEDLGINNDRAAQDAEQTRQDSILTAQEALNTAMLEADAQYAKDKAAIWDDMYATIKSSVFTALTEIAVQKAAMWAWEAAGDVLSANTKVVTKTAAATGEITVETAKSAVMASLSEANTVAAYAPIPFVGLGIAAGVIALMYAAQSSGGSIPSTPSIPTPAPTPAAKFHTGGLITGASQEVPITAYKGEGVLNTYNGMKAIGGQAGLNQANATGALGTTNQEPKGNTTLILEFKDDSGKTNKTITLDNLEDLLRGAAGKTMRKVVNDGVNLGYS